MEEQTVYHDSLHEVQCPRCKRVVPSTRFHGLLDMCALCLREVYHLVLTAEGTCRREEEVLWKPAAGQR
jgi:hypothetical protein